ncbi:MAG: diguanylate cyclase [Nitrosomonadales bacterium]|nr:diguanylate cyclase [Nitrosomonadales bacterium]
MKLPRPKLSFSVKLTSFLLMISILPLLTFLIVSYGSIRRTVIDDAVHDNMQMLSYQRDYLNLQMEQIEGLVTNLSSIDEVNAALESSGKHVSVQPSYDTLSTKAHIGYVLSNYSSLHGLVSIDLFALNGIQYHVGDTLNVANVRVDLRDRLLQSSVNSPNQLLWHGVEDNVNTASSSRKVIVATKAINRWEQTKAVPAGMLLINFSTDYLHAYFSRLDLGEGAYMMIIDAQRRLLFHPEKKLIGQGVESGLSSLLKGESGSLSVVLDGRAVLLNYLLVPDKGWYVINVVPEEALTASLKGVEVIGVLLLLSNLLLIGLFIRAYLRRVVFPLRSIAEGFEQFQAGRIEPNRRLSPPRATLGEITDLVAWFNTFLDTMESNRQAQISLRIAATAFESQEGMVITDTDTVILKVNKAFTEITGYTSEEVVGRKISMLKSGRHDRSFYEALWENIKRTGSWHGEIWNKRKDGSIYPEWLTITSVKGEDGLVTHYVGTLTDISARKAAESEIRQLAFYDTLTQLPNRRLLHERLERALTASRRSGRFIALMFLDLDNFKPLNDTYGHDVGDMLLVEVARRLGSCIRETDTVARFGGDEFVVMLGELDLEKESSITQAGAVAEKIRSALSEPYLLKVRQADDQEGALEYRCTSSIGVVVFGSQECTIEDALKWADIAMYRAKEEGRNCVQFHK